MAKGYSRDLRVRAVAIVEAGESARERHDITFKKDLHAAEQDRPDVAAARAGVKAEQPQRE